MAKKIRVADLALDLGTASTRVIGPEGLLFEVESIIALRGREVLSIGESAARLEGRAPPNVDVIRPVRGGTVIDFRAAERLIGIALQKAGARGMRRPKVLLAQGREATEVERRAALESLRSAGARDVAVVDRMLATALGAGLAVTEPVGQLIVDLGAGGSRASIVSLGGSVVQRATASGGDSLNGAIEAWFRESRGMVVERRSAENLKHHLVDLAGATTKQTRIRGRAPSGSGPMEEAVSTPDLNTAIDGEVQRIRELLRDVLRRASPELSADLIDRGAVLCGGGTGLKGLDSILRQDTELAVVNADDPPHACSRGCATLLSDADLYAQLVEGRS